MMSCQDILQSRSRKFVILREVVSELWLRVPLNERFAYLTHVPKLKLQPASVNRRSLMAVFVFFDLARDSR